MVALNPLIKLQNALGAEKNTVSNALANWGYLLLLISLTLYGIGEVVNVRSNDQDLTVFFIHYLIALGYAGLLLFNSSLGIIKSWRREHIHGTLIALNLFLISAYALNRNLPVFDNSTAWWCYYLIGCSGVLLSFRFFDALPASVNSIQYLLLGSALVSYLYLAVYCAGFYGIGVIGLLFFGVGGHILVPIFLVIACFMLIFHSGASRRTAFMWTGIGVTITVGIVAVFSYVWNRRIESIERLSTLSVLDTDSDLPAWVKVAATTKHDWITEKLLKSGLVYRLGDPARWSLFRGQNNWDEQRKHDPLVLISSLFRRPPLSEDERIRILEVITDDRHKAQERLWSGDHLITSGIVTDTDIYPDLRLAYTERYFNIRHDGTAPGQRSAQEAIYTFQLPEGSVVTALSLWVNGREEKAILTSKQKATDAYTTIVGVESRDPSVIHWQEGNTVVVRVFPCTPTEERKFRIGITSPLPEENGRLMYKNIRFRGPSAHNAREVFRIRFIGNPTDAVLPGGFVRNEKGEYIREQDYNTDFQISLRQVPLKQNQFTFDGHAYSLLALETTLEKRSFSSVYLDLNNSWTSAELNELRPLLKSRSVYVYGDGDFIRLTESNWDTITSTRRTHNFSIFPFHRLTNEAEALVVSKGRELSPFLADFKHSRFAGQISEFFAKGRKVYLYNVSTSASTYIRSLRELRALHYASGSIAELEHLLEKEQYPLVTEDASQIALHDARLAVTKTHVSEATSDNAPDHLARLFAYNNIMRQVGAHFFADNFINEQLVQEATAAYVVSPVSSLIVLETQADYERFGIKDSNNSLHNASRKSSGAVPEPHEWALIAMFGLLVFYCISKQRRDKIVQPR